MSKLKKVIGVGAIAVVISGITVFILDRLKQVHDFKVDDSWEDYDDDDEDDFDEDDFDDDDYFNKSEDIEKSEINPFELINGGTRSEVIDILLDVYKDDNSFNYTKETLNDLSDAELTQLYADYKVSIK